MSDVSLTLSVEQHQKAVQLALMLQSVVMGDGVKTLKFSSSTRADFLRWMDELISLLEVAKAFDGDQDDGALGSRIHDRFSGVGGVDIE